MCSPSIVSAMICDTARLRNHLWLAGMTNQDESLVRISKVMVPCQHRAANDANGSQSLDVRLDILASGLDRLMLVFAMSKGFFSTICCPNFTRCTRTIIPRTSQNIISLPVSLPEHCGGADWTARAFPGGRISYRSIGVLAHPGLLGGSVITGVSPAAKSRIPPCTFLQRWHTLRP